MCQNEKEIEEDPRNAGLTVGNHRLRTALRRRQAVTVKDSKVSSSTIRLRKLYNKI